MDSSATPNSSMPYACLAAFAFGVASHLLYFRIGEHHMLGTTYLQLFFMTCVCSAIALVYFTETRTPAALHSVLFLGITWLAGVFGSLVVYRAFFHPLNRFPGPWKARFGDLWLSSQVTALNAYYVFYELHKKHGRYVRIGSNTLSITDPEIMQPAYGSNAKASKADWYDGPHPYHSMHSTRDRSLHDRRRRVWAPAFSDKALRGYESIVDEVNKKFCDKIGQYEGQPVNASTAFNLYGFDVMGRLAFDKDYGMVESGQRHWAIDLTSSGMEIAGFKLPTWLFRILVVIPGAAANHHKFLNFCADELKWRCDRGKDAGKDITGWLLKAYTGEPHPDKDPMLRGDSRLIVVAGSDTTSATLTYLFYHLALDPDQQKRLREELGDLIGEGWSDKDIQHADHLNGVINETLRLHPPVPSGLMRETLPEGLRIGDTFVPGNTNFCTPQYPMGRDEKIYTDATSFVPERWYSKPEMVKHLDAFAPFSMGPMGCIGRNLARMELRTLTAQLLLRYNVSLAPGEDGTRLMTKTKDHFTVAPGQLDLVFTPTATQ